MEGSPLHTNFTYLSYIPLKSFHLNINLYKFGLLLQIGTASNIYLYMSAYSELSNQYAFFWVSMTVNTLKWKQFLFIWNRDFQKWGTISLKKNQGIKHEILLVWTNMPLNPNKRNLNNSYIPSDAKFLFYFAKETKIGKIIFSNMTAIHIITLKI